MASASFISTILPPMAANAMAICKYIADKAVDKAVDKVMDKPMDKAIDWVVDKVDGIVNIERDISKLQTTLLMIQSIVQEAEEKQIDNVFIRNWLQDLVDIAYESRDVLDDFITFSSCIITAEGASNPVNIISSFMLSYFGGSSSDTSNIPLTVLNRLAKDIRSVKERFDEKIKESETFTKLKSVVGGGGSESVRVDRRPEVGPFINKQRDALFLGREEVKQGIMKKILHPSDDHVHVVVIWGMGGIGKTTLALSIYNDGSVKKVPKRWLPVGVNKFNAEKIIREIVIDKKTTGIVNLQTKLQEKLMGDRFLIVLDDVWDVDGSEWDLLFNPLTNVGKGGLIIITRRERELCAAITIQTAYNLKPLSEENSWLIFERCAFIDGKSDTTPDLKRIGKKIVKKLNGLPLALKVVGRSLLNKDYSTWTKFLESKLTTKDDEVMSALRWSYNHLPPHLKMCFTYCSLFPKDHVLDKKVLVQMWMAHDLIQKEEQERPEDVGGQYFEELVNASLLQCVDGKHVMHDLIHDLALLVSNGEFASANSSLTNDQMKKVRHITITGDDYSKMEKLLTLYKMDKWINRRFMCLDSDIFKLKSIRVLVLVAPEIRLIPYGISELRHLRYLDVSKTRVTRLPDSLCHLYNLQLIATRDVELPRNIVNISSLRYVRANLSTCKGVGKLTSLQELSSIHVCEGDDIRELGDMQRLHGKLRIKGLGNVEKLEDDVGALMEKQTLMDELELVFNQHSAESIISDEEVLNALGCPANLTYLRIAGYNGLKPPSWMVDGKHKFNKLHTLELYDCPKLESLPPLGELASLKRLSLESVGVKRLGEEFYGKFTNGKVFFPSLESLHFSYMFRWEKWDDVIIKNSNVSFFPSLTRLKIDKCHYLTSLPPLGELTSLKHFSLESVGVKRLGDEFYGKFTDGKVFFPSLESLEFSFMPEWEEWDDIIIENSSVSFFPSLTKLKIERCAKLVSVLQTVSNAADFMKSISSWKIDECPKLISCLPVVKKWEDDEHPIMNAANFMTSLSSLKIRLQLDALVSLKYLNISRCKSLVHITSAICLAATIERLQISYCEQLQTMGFEELPSLTHLDVKRCNNLISIPRLVGIKVLNLHECVSLRSLNINVHGLDSLEELDITGCPKLELAFEDGSSSSSSSGNSVAVPLHYISTDSTQVFRTLLHHELVSLKSLNITNLGGFENFDETEANNFCKSRSLKSLHIWQCKDLKSLPADFHKLSSLMDLWIKNCPQLQSLPPDFHKLSFLESLHIESCTQLLSLPPDFHKLSSLKILNISSCTQLQSLPPDFHKLSSLRDFSIKNCPQLQSLPPDFHKLSSFQRLSIESCTQLLSLLPYFHKLSSLKELNIKSCLQLQSLPPDLHKLSSLKSLSINHCPQLQSLPPDFHKLSSLEELDINDCPQLQSLPPDFHKLSSLNSLSINFCPQLQSLPVDGLPPSLSKMSLIPNLFIRHCPLLYERCKDKSGLDWHKIEHIHRIIEDW